MKNLLLLVLVSITFNTQALDFLGGTVKSKNGEELGLTCGQFSAENVCESIFVQHRYEGGEFYHTATLNRINPTEIAKDAKDEAKNELNQDYVTAGFIGTGIGGLAMYYGGTNPFSLLVFGTGVAFDVVKAPFVLTSFIGHKFTDLFAKKRLKKLTSFMMSKEKIGKSKKTRNRYFEALLDTLAY